MCTGVGWCECAVGDGASNMQTTIPPSAQPKSSPCEAGDAEAPRRPSVIHAESEEDATVGGLKPRSVPHHHGKDGNHVRYRGASPAHEDGEDGN